MKFNLTVLFAILATVHSARAAHVWINEFHYDNAGADTGEFVEVVVKDTPGGQDLSQVRLNLYNGLNGKTYDNVTLDDANVVPTAGSGFTFYAWPGVLQNGPPDGISLTVDGTVAQFLSYEGSFTATDGPANGLTSVDIGVSETSSTLIGGSLGLVGTGMEAADFGWSTLSLTPGNPNQGQTLVPEPGTALLALLGLGFTLLRRRRR